MSRYKRRGLSSWLRAYGLFAGGVIGVGVFGLPAALVRAGLLAFLLHLALVGILVWVIHRWYLDVVVATRGRHRLPGYARKYLGPQAFRVAAVANLLGLLGALVAYLLVGGQFLRLLLAPFVFLSPVTATVLYALPGILLLSFGRRALPSVELGILVLFLGVLLALPVVAGDAFSWVEVPWVVSGLDVFLPYGVLLFSLWGLSLVPETRELAGRSPKAARAVMAAGLLTAVMSYLFFAVFVAGLTGSATTPDALTGLRQTLGDGAVALTLLFGVLTTFSSYLALGLTLRRTLELDFHLPRARAVAFTVGPPLAALALGLPSLLIVLSVTGAVFLGLEGVVVLLLRRAIRGPNVMPLRPSGLVLCAVLLTVGTLGALAALVLS